ncbi:hypothetical protein K1719_002622 [Acacia pycnantha]|nr:hypothetical protein K1719_002622 [Acacia pycnantha]
MNTLLSKTQDFLNEVSSLHAKSGQNRKLFEAKLRSAHKLLRSSWNFNDMFDTLSTLLHKTAYRCHVKFGIEMASSRASSAKRKMFNSSYVLTFLDVYMAESKTGAAGSSSPILEIGEIFQLVEVKDGEPALLAKALELYLN